MLKLSDKNSSEGLVFERANSGNEEILESLFRCTFDTYVQLLGRERSEGPNDWLPRLIEEGNVWVAIRGNDIFGAVTLVPEGDNWSIDEIAVPPQLQGKGIGSWMLE